MFSNLSLYPVTYITFPSMPFSLLDNVGNDDDIILCTSTLQFKNNISTYYS